ncbi:hypothetical protein [Burkholderia aenigmatica]|nr:hypothetical protein [Burkholderia aenigmatica]
MTADALVGAQSVLATGQGILIAVVLVTGFYDAQRDTTLTGVLLLGLA